MIYISELFRSATYTASTGDCRLADMDRHTVAGTGAFRETGGAEYLENNCVDDPVKLCDFQRLENRIMKTVDSVYQVIYQLIIYILTDALSNENKCAIHTAFSSNENWSYDWSAFCEE